MKKRNRRISFFKEVQRFPMILVFFLFCHADDSGAAQTRIFAEHSVNTTFVFHCQLILVYTIFIYQCIVYSFRSQLAQAFVEFSRTSLLVSISCDDEFVFRILLDQVCISFQVHCFFFAQVSLVDVEERYIFSCIRQLVASLGFS